MNFQLNRIVPRASNKFATTNMINELVGVLNGMHPQFVVGEGRPRPFPDFAFYASIATAGPNGESNYTDARYWCKPLYLPSAATDGKLGGLGASGPGTPDGGASLGVSVVTATNLSELSYGVVQTGTDSHLLLEGQVVRVKVWADVGGPADSANPDGKPAAVHYVFELPPENVLAVDLTVDGGTNPNYTYSMTYRTVTINTAQVPRVPRYTTSVTAANFGYAHIDGTGGSKRYVLGWCNEAPGTFVCPSS